MELIFREETYPFLRERRCEDIYQEQTAETIIPESMSEIGQIMDSFGTVLVQNRTVDNGSVTVSGGIQAGVLYLPESGDQLERVEVWIPFTVTKKMQTQEDSTVFYWGWLRSIDARLINPRKILVRANLGSEITLMEPTELKLSCLEKAPTGLECRVNTYPMRLPLCAAEKELQIADEVLMPEGEAGMDTLLKSGCSVEIDETRSIGDKAVFKGNLSIRVLYRTEEGETAGWSCKVPFSQYAELSREIEDGVVTVQPILRHMEIDTDGQPDSHRLLLNITVIAQVVVRGILPLALTEDAYCLMGELEPKWQTVELMPCLDVLSRDITESLTLPADAARVLDCTVLPDRATVNRDNAQLNAELRVHVLYCNEAGKLQSRLLRQTLKNGDAGELPEDAACCLRQSGEAQQTGALLRIPMNAELVCLKKMTYQNLCGGEVKEGETAEGPSLIVKTVQGELWDLARTYRTTVRAIRTANGLDADAIKTPKLLLIPTGQAAMNGEECVK